MRRSDLPFLADLIAISLRWVTLLAVSAWLGWVKQLSAGVVLVVLILAVWNLLLSILAVFNIRLKQHRLINILIDIIASACLFIFSGGPAGSLAWIGVLPVLTASIYYEWLGSLLSTLIVSALQTIITFIASNNINQVVLQLLLNLVFGVVGGLGSLGLMTVLRREYQKQVAQ
ncbi:MAG: hypothetical protein HGA53_04540, partial [Anaerolineaceae bacterium]|nr:hypothetical protein [Anaerolineaceae bacterium]